MGGWGLLAVDVCEYGVGVCKYGVVLCFFLMMVESLISKALPMEWYAVCVCMFRF